MIVRPTISSTSLRVKLEDTREDSPATLSAAFMTERVNSLRGPRARALMQRRSR
jgi:hypothetical protein